MTREDCIRSNLRLITYEAERIEFFAKRMRKAQNRYERLYKKLDGTEPYLSLKRQEVDDAARMARFYQDVVEILEKELKER
jgi:hypothetical protein